MKRKVLEKKPDQKNQEEPFFLGWFRFFGKKKPEKWQRIATIRLFGDPPKGGGLVE
jgi:hypothetical protein